MPDRRNLDRAGRVAAAMAGLLLLAGCFTTARPLITPENADFPFRQITLISEGKEIVLKRDGKAYAGFEAGKTEPDPTRYRFHELAGNMFLVEAGETNDKGKYEGLMGIIRRQGKRLAVLAPTCSDAPPEDLAAARITRKPARSLFPECEITSLEQMKILASRLQDKPVKEMVMTIKMITK